MRRLVESLDVGATCVPLSLIRDTGNHSSTAWKTQLLEKAAGILGANVKRQAELLEVSRVSD